jgi:hypothetical protein
MMSLPPDLLTFTDRHHAWFTKNRRIDGSYFILTMCVIKLGEELGEFGQTQTPAINPKTGVAFSNEDAAGELCDMVTTALMGFCEAVADTETFPDDLAVLYARLAADSDTEHHGAPLSVLSLLVDLTVQFGRVSDALCGVTGFTPRKGFYGDDAQLAKHLCAVARTGLRGLGLLVEDPDAFLAAHLQRGETRRLAAVAPPPPPDPSPCPASRPGASR